MNDRLNEGDAVVHDALDARRLQASAEEKWGKLVKNEQNTGRHVAAGEPMTIYMKTHRNRMFFSSVDHLGKW